MSNVPSEALKLGNVLGKQQTLALSPEGRSTHLYVCGATGTGKSKFLEHLIRQDIINWRRRNKSGLLLIDPHGGIYDSLMAWLPTQLALERPIIPIDLRDEQWVCAFNVLRNRSNADPAVVINSFVKAMAHVWGQAGTVDTPKFDQWATAILQLLYDNQLTLADAVHVLKQDNKAFRQQLAEQLSDEGVVRNWTLADKLNWKDFEEYVGSSVRRLETFVKTEVMRLVFGQSDVSLDLETVLNEGHIVLVSLARQGRKISKDDAQVFGSLLLDDLWSTAEETRNKHGAPNPFHVYLDEFQKFVTPTIAENLDEARGFGLHFTMAHQFPNQLANSGEYGKKLYDSVMNNARNKVVFQLSQREQLEPLAEWLFMGSMDPMKVKDEIWSRKVVNYREEYRTLRGHSRSHTEQGASQRSESHGDTRSIGTTMTTSSHRDADGNYAGDSTSHGISDSVASSWAESTTESHSWSDASSSSESQTVIQVPEFGQEVSNRQFWSLEEQLFVAMAAIFEQPQRHCIARLEGMKTPVCLEVPLIDPGLASVDRIARYKKRLYSELPFVKLKETARQHLEERKRQIQTRIEEAKQERQQIEESSSSKRRIAKKANPRKKPPSQRE